MDPQQNQFQPPAGGQAPPGYQGVPTTPPPPQATPNDQQAHVAQYAVTPMMQAQQAIPDASMTPGVPTGGPVGTPAVPGQVQAGQVDQNGKPLGQTPPAKTNPNSTQNTLKISEIRDGVVIMNDGTFRSVIMCKTINFDLMSQGEREAVEFSYQSFLNSLYFPVQIFIKSTKVDMRPYLERLNKIRLEHDNMLLALLMEDYIEFMAVLTQQTNIMDKKFYMVIPYTPPNTTAQTVQKGKSFFDNIFGFNKKQETVVIDEATLEKAKTELRNQVQAVLNSLTQMGIQALPLDTQELIELYYDVYNPDTATRQQIQNFDDLTAPVVTKGQGEASQPNLDNTLAM